MQPAIDSAAPPAPRSSYSDIAIEILQATRDGNELERHHLRLLELAVNGFLSEAGEIAFEQLHRSVMTGAYATEPHWLHNIEHLTIDHEGYVYWRGQTVEHYSFTDIERERAAATELARRCRRLEGIGMPVDSRTVLLRSCYDAPAGTPWKPALRYYYAFFDGATSADSAAVFYRASGKPFAVMCLQGTPSAQDYPYVLDAYRALEAAGFRAVGGQHAYEEIALRLSRLGWTPTELADAIGASAAPT